MAEIQCPNCGRTNPEGREECEYCGSPLPQDVPSTGQDISAPRDQFASPSDVPSDGKETGQGKAQEEPPEFEDEGELGWLDVLHAAEEGEEPSEMQPAAEKKEGKEDTDWLQRIRDLDVEGEKSEEPPEEEEAFPDWISEPKGEKEPQKAPSEGKQGLPDWLQPEEEEKEAAPEEEEAAAPPSPEPAQEEEFPSWLAEGEEPLSEGEKTIQPFDLDEEDEFLDDLFDEELPSWLTSVDMDEETETDLESDISPGELPGWVEAMRPVVESSDTSGLAEDEEYIENYGPLAGIPSVLPAEAEIDQIRAEDVKDLTFDLKVTKTQREYTSLLENVISQERKVKPSPKPTKIPTQRILRWFIALILLLSVGASIVAGGWGDIQPTGGDPDPDGGYTALYEMIDGLEEEDTALIVFDYQPALAGELNATASGVVDHLLSQKSYVALVSTQPTGPSLAEYFISRTQAEHEYQHGKDYINLGYIPGQTAGVLSFSIAPREIVPIAFNGANAWGSPPLKEVESFSDFALVLIITDDPTTARIWIEQIKPYISKSKVGMVVSAQAEPLVRPYYETSPQQISGLVAGLPGGRIYEGLAEKPNLSSGFLFPLNVGIIVTVLTVFIGGLANGILNLIKQQQNKEKRGGP
ncbi:MAG: zinc ribbon domain-containing protein [Anaerolineales bacterium]